MSKGLKFSLPLLEKHFPSTAVYRTPRPGQRQLMEFGAIHGSMLGEAPTGIGKTAVEYAFAMAAREQLERNGDDEGVTWIITPNKTILDQIKNEFPDLKTAVGRNEHPCLYYHDDKAGLTPEKVAGFYDDLDHPRADDIPCLYLQDCPHRVNSETGETYEPGAYRCPYYQQKYEAKKERVVLATMAFYLFTHVFTKHFDTEVVIIDEVHRLPDVVRALMSYDITDWHLTRAADILKDVDPNVARVLRKFVATMMKISKKKYAGYTELLEPKEIERLLAVISEIDQKALSASIKQAIKDGKIDPRKDMVTLKKLEVITRDIGKYFNSLKYSLPWEREDGEVRQPLNYTCAYRRVETKDGEPPTSRKIQYKLVVKAYYVVPLIKRILPSTVISLSATIGKPEIFGYESGIKDPFISVGSNFPTENTRLYIPTDVPDLTFKYQSDRDLPRTLRRMVVGAKEFAKEGIRSLIITVSEKERQTILSMAKDNVTASRVGTLDVVSYGDGMTAKQAALLFKSGVGEALVGTAANYAEGVDLPKGIAPVIWFLRPSYANPNDPAAMFEERRFGNMVWKLREYRVGQQALQVRGRNVRGRNDVGVTFYMSQQFKRFLFSAMPDYLKPAYKNTMDLEQAKKDAMKLLKA